MPTIPSLLLLVLLLSFLSSHACYGRLLHSQVQHSTKGEEQELMNGSAVGGISGGATTRTANSRAKTMTGTEELMPSPRAGLSQANQTVGLTGGRERSLLGYGSREETIEPDEKVVVDDSLSMDYQMPQRGPSIHNR